MKEPQLINLVHQFGMLMNQPHQVEEILRLLRNVPDAKSFEVLRSTFYNLYKHPFLPTFLNGLSESDHVRLLHAFKKKSSDYK